MPEYINPQDFLYWDTLTGQNYKFPEYFNLEEYVDHTRDLAASFMLFIDHITTLS